jgi:DNA-binding transcriptional LysR family regulator
MNISLRQMRAFSAVTQSGSFTGAARQLHLTQSAVSMLVLQLEQELHLQLFDRNRTAVTLTEAGKNLLPLAQRILEDVRQVVEGATEIRALRRGFLRVATSQMMACTWVAAVLTDFGYQHPEVSLRLKDVVADDVVDVVRNGVVELGIGPERVTGHDVTRSFLVKVPIHLVCSKGHPAYERGSVSWNDLRKERWISYSNEFGRHVERELHTHGHDFSLDPVSDVEFLTTALALAGHGMGVLLAPAYASLFAANFGVRFVPLRGPAIQREYFVYQRKGQSLSPSATAFLDMLRQQALAAGRGGYRDARGGTSGNAD